MSAFVDNKQHTGNIRRLAMHDGGQCCRNRFTVDCSVANVKSQRIKEMFYLTTHSTHFVYGYMASVSENKVHYFAFFVFTCNK